MYTSLTCTQNRYSQKWSVWKKKYSLVYTFFKNYMNKSDYISQEKLTIKVIINK